MVVMTMDSERLKAYLVNFGSDEPPPADYRVARGVMGWKVGDEPAEVTIRKLRDGDDRGTTLIGRDDYELLLTLLSDELGADTDNESMHAMLLALQAALVNARRWRIALEWYATGTNWEASHYADDGTFDYETIPAIIDGGARASEAMRKPLSDAAIAWGERRLRELGLLDSDDTEGGA